LAIYDEQGYLSIGQLGADETKTMVGIGSLRIKAEAKLKGHELIANERIKYFKKQKHDRNWIIQNYMSDH